MSEQWLGLHNPERHEKVYERTFDSVCVLCRGRCAEDEPCRCCLEVEVESLRARIAAALALLAEGGHCEWCLAEDARAALDGAE